MYNPIIDAQFTMRDIRLADLYDVDIKYFATKKEFDKCIENLILIRQTKFINAYNLNH